MQHNNAKKKKKCCVSGIQNELAVLYVIRQPSLGECTHFKQADGEWSMDNHALRELSGPGQDESLFVIATSHAGPTLRPTSSPSFRQRLWSLLTCFKCDAEHISTLYDSPKLPHVAWEPCPQPILQPHILLTPPLFPNSLHTVLFQPVT